MEKVNRKDYYLSFWKLYEVSKNKKVFCKKIITKQSPWAII